jgi:hypothetical protein
MADRVEIKIQTVGDASGAEKVAKGLDQIQKSADQAGKAVGTGSNGLGGKMAQLFPTFTKAGSAVAGFAGQMAGMVNPATIATAVIGAVVAKAVSAYNDIQRAEEGFAEYAGTGWQKLNDAVGSYLPTQTALETAIKNSTAALESYGTALSNQEAAIAKRITDETALADSANKLAIARLELAVAEGKLTEEEAARQKAVLEADTAEQKFQAQQAAAVSVLQARQTALAQINAEMERLKSLEAEATARATASEGMSMRDRAAGLDPRLNANVSNASREQIAATAGGEQDTTGAMAERAMEGGIGMQMARVLSPLFGIYDILDAASDEATRAADMVEAAKKAEEEFNKAVEARAAALNAQAEQSRKEVETYRAALAAAQARATSAAAGVATASGTVASYGPGGTASTVFSNQQEAAQTAAMAGDAGNATATPAVDPAALSGLANSPASQELMRRLADGIQAREVAFLQQLVGVLDFQNQGSSSGTKAEIEKLKKQLEDLRAKL